MNSNIIIAKGVGMFKAIYVYSSKTYIVMLGQQKTPYHREVKFVPAPKITTTHTYKKAGEI